MFFNSDSILEERKNPFLNNNSFIESNSFNTPLNYPESFRKINNGIH